MTFHYEAEVEVSEEELDCMAKLAKRYYAEKMEGETLCDCVWRACYALAGDWYAYDFIALHLEDEVLRRVIEGEENN